MTLFDISRKNIKGNAGNYLLYFLSELFSVVVYYTFVSLQYSTEIADAVESSQSMRSIFMMASMILILFVTAFALYSNSFFARKRKKEVGLYSLLGLPRKTIGKLLFYENLLIGVMVLVTGIAVGTILSKLFSMILVRLLGVPVDVGMTFSVQALVQTVVVFTAIILFTSIQSYRLIYKYKLVELFRAEQEGEPEPKASVIAAVAAVLLLVAGYWFAFRSFSNSEEILTSLGVVVGGIIVGTMLLFSSLVVFLLKWAKRRKRSYYRGMNLVSTANLVYRIKGNARSLAVISLLSAAALCAFSVGFGMYYSYAETVRLTAPYSYMHIAQGEGFDQTVEALIRGDQAHPVLHHIKIPVVRTKGQAPNPILSGREIRADENPLKVVSIDTYNRVARALGFSSLASIKAGEAVAIRPMYTDYGPSDYQGKRIVLTLPQQDLPLIVTGMTVERVLNWSYPDVMIVVSNGSYQEIAAQVAPTNYIGYAVQQQETTKATADALARIRTPESQLSAFYSEYRLGLEGAAFNVFVLGFLGLIFVMATGSIIYFKQLTEAMADTPRYEILKKIGVSSRQLGIAIIQQNAFIFVLPMIIGLAHYVVILSLVQRMLSSIAGTSLLPPILICVTVFVLIYAGYFLLTVNSIVRMVNGKSAPTVRIAAVLAVTCVLAVMGVLFGAGSPQVEILTGEKLQLALPKPTGTFAVGTFQLQLVDSDRVDPWVDGRNRELMISIWYPAEREAERKAPYMQPGAAKHYDEKVIPTIGLDSGRIDLAGTSTNAWLEAPVARNEAGWPVLLYSPGGAIPRNFGTVLVEDLASRGYVVVTVDHTYETSVVEFLDGRVITERLPAYSADTILKMNAVRVKDNVYVLDELERINAGHPPHLAEGELPVGLMGALDLSRVGIFGHSAGGATAAELMYEDQRIDAGIDMDGTMGFMPDHPLPVAQHGLDRPFMLMNAGYNDDGEVDSHLSARDRKSFWEHSTGWKLDLSIPAGAHYTFTDYQVLLPQLRDTLSISPRVIQQSIGTADPEQTVTAQRSYVAAFFDQHLKQVSQPLLLSPSTDFPGVEFVR